MTETMPRPIDPVDPFTFVLHGSSGDLARRKILPALAHLAANGYFQPGSRIILAQRQPVTPEEALAQQDEFLAGIGEDAARASLPALKPLLCTVALTWAMRRRRKGSMPRSQAPRRRWCTMRHCPHRASST